MPLLLQPNTVSLVAGIGVVDLCCGFGVRRDWRWWFHFLCDPNATIKDTPQVPYHPTSLLLAQGFMYWGAKADLNVWNPYIEQSDEHSSAQIWVKSGPYTAFESVEAGWAVNPTLYGDTRTRLFSYWTTPERGCFDLRCSGFVQTSKTISLGAAIDPISSLFREQYHITIFIFKDPVTYHWWLQFGEKELIGYWPRDLFVLLQYPATLIQWGGEVYSRRLGNPHTATAMGSGQYADGLFGFASFIRNIRVLESSYVLKYPEFVGTHGDELYCYSLLNYRQSWMPEPEFYYGGPGRSFNCP